MDKKKDFPYNFYEDLLGESVDSITEDMQNGLRYALSTLDTREQSVLRDRYIFKLTYAKIGDQYSRLPENMRKVINRSLRRLRHPSRSSYIIYGLEQTKLRQEELAKQKESRLQKVGDADDIANLELSFRGYNCLKRAGINTKGELLNFINTHGVNWHTNIRNLGVRAKDDIELALRRTF